MTKKHYKYFMLSYCLLLIILNDGCAVGVGDRTPTWNLQDLSGQQHTLADYSGKTVVLYFWATWCAPCKVMSSRMQNIHETYSDRNVVVLSIHYNNEGDPERYMKRNDYAFTVLDNGLTVANRMGVSKIPTVFIINPDGQVVYRQTGFAAGDKQRMIEMVERLSDQHVAIGK